jgi:molybdopterin-containing oxidoreductase family membrane subunit
MTTLAATAPAGRNMMYLAGAALLTAVAGGYVLMQLMSQGHAAFNTTSAGLMWGLPIITYDYFLLTSTGLVMVAALGLVFGIEDFRVIARRCLWLSLAALVGGVAVLFLELGYPVRALLLGPTSFQTASPLFWKMLLVGIYTVLLLIALLTSGDQLRRGEGGGLTTLLAAFAVAITLVAGSVYGLMAMRPMWFGGEVPVAFLIESFVGGLAFAMFFTYLVHGFSQQGMDQKLTTLLNGKFATALATAISLHLVFVVGRAVTGLWSNASGLQVWQHIVSQPLFHIGLWGGTVLPLLLLMTSARANPMMQVVASLLVMVGLLISRYEFIIGGQLVPLFKGSWVRGLIEYQPSIAEWALLAVGVGIANLVYAAAIAFRDAES